MMEGIHTCPVSLLTEGLYYCIALKFRGSKFLQIAIFEDFIEIVLQIRWVSKIFVEIFSQMIEIREIREIRKIKDLRKFGAIRYILPYI